MSESPVEAKKESGAVANRRYDNNRIYTTYTWRDETSQFDPKGQWCGGSDAYWRDYAARVPRRLLATAEKSGDFDPVMTWIERNEHKEIWR